MMGKISPRGFAKTKSQRLIIRHLRMIVSITLCLSMLVCVFPQVAWAEAGFHADWTEEGKGTVTIGGDSGTNHNGNNSVRYAYETASNVGKLIDICQKYSDKGTTTGVRNQIDWMRQLYASAVQGYCSQLGWGDALLISLLNHSKINTTLMTSSYSIGDLNREVAKKIVEQAVGYTDINAIADATGLSVQDVHDILERIAAGSITENTIAIGKKSSQNTNRGAYLRSQAVKQEKVFNYLIEEVERMTADPDSLNILYQDLGAGFVSNLLSGYQLDEYQVMLYKKYLAQVLDDTLESKNPYSVSDYDITKTDAYNAAKKTKSVLSGLIQYEIGATKEALPEELQKFWEEHLKNGILSESEAREYLILCGQYKEGEYGIGEAAKQLVNGYKHLQKLETVLDAVGDGLSKVEKVTKALEFIEYWLTDYAQQEVLLDYLTADLSNDGSDMEMMVAAKELQQEYEDKLSGTFDKVYSELINKGIGSVKLIYPPFTIADTCIALSGILTGADDRVKALETGLAMQGICKQALDKYENAVIAVSNGDTSPEAVSKVINTFELARQSLVCYYRAMVQLAGTDEEKAVYSAELEKLEKVQFGYAFVSFVGGR